LVSGSGLKVAFNPPIPGEVAAVECREAGRGVDIGGRRDENAGHMKEISTPPATLLLT
jgi:hypothetical protein